MPRRRAAARPIRRRLLVLPGSRRGEISRLMSMFGEALRTLAATRRPVEVVAADGAASCARMRGGEARWPVPPRIVIDARPKNMAPSGSRARRWPQSGTVTLELALAGVPMVAAYRCR